eukprot:116273-Amphidinium_carterae.2
MRLTQAMSDASVIRWHCFVDDPIGTVRGTQSEIHLELALVMLMWRVHGLDLATHKGQVGRTVQWIGFELTIGIQQ